MSEALPPSETWPLLAAYALNVLVLSPVVPTMFREGGKSGYSRDGLRRPSRCGCSSAPSGWP